MDSLTYNQQSELINAVLKLGYKPTKEILSKIQGGISEDNFAFLEEPVKEPLALQNLSRLFIRSTSNPNVTFAAQSLPIPMMIKKCL